MAEWHGRGALFPLLGVLSLSACSGGRAIAPAGEAGRAQDAAVAREAGGRFTDAGPLADGTATCPAARLLAGLGRDHFLVGMQANPGSNDLTVFETSGVPFDIRYLYIAGGVASGGPCTSCTSSCSALPAGSPSGNWWGCWQDTSLPPGRYVQDVVTEAESHGAIPMVTYYEVLQSSGAAEGTPEVAALGTDADLTKSILLDYAFLLDRIHAVAKGPVLVQLEPDFWGYAQMLNADPTKSAVALAGADPADCAGLPNTIAGFGECLVAITRAHAPEVRLAFHLSAWADSVDAYKNTDPTHDVAADADADAAFLAAVGATHADFFTLDTDDHDGAYNMDLWDPTNATLPDFTQALAFAGRAATDLGLPAMWWQTPLGNPSMPNSCNTGTCTSCGYKDNRVDYFFAHPDQFTAAGGFAIVFGAGNPCQTDSYSDGGNFVKKAGAYFAGGGLAPSCP